VPRCGLEELEKQHAQDEPVRDEILVNGLPTAEAVSTVMLGTYSRPAIQSAWAASSALHQLPVRRSAHRPFRQRPGDEQHRERDDSGRFGHGRATGPTLLSVLNGGGAICPVEL